MEQQPGVLSYIQQTGIKLRTALEPIVKEQYPNLDYVLLEKFWSDMTSNVSSWYIFMTNHIVPRRAEIENGSLSNVYEDTNGDQFVASYDILPGITLHSIPIETYKTVNKCLMFYLNVYNMSK
jgi:hypothetical protein